MLRRVRIPLSGPTGTCFFYAKYIKKNGSFVLNLLLYLQINHDHGSDYISVSGVLFLIVFVSVSGLPGASHQEHTRRHHFD